MSVTAFRAAPAQAGPRSSHPDVPHPDVPHPDVPRVGDPTAYDARLGDPAACDAWSDQDLVRAVRAGDMQAAGVLYARYHPFAVRAARSIGNPGIAEDLASDALTKVVAALLNGRGPDTAVRAYLTTTIRHLFADRLRTLNGEILVDPATSTMDRAEPDPTELALERSVVLDVLAELPDRWREVLWRTIVLEQPLAVVGASMGLNANATAALSYRARNALTKAYVRAVGSGAA